MKHSYNKISTQTGNENKNRNNTEKLLTVPYIVMYNTIQNTLRSDVST